MSDTNIHIAEASKGLVDQTITIELEHIDPTSLPRKPFYRTIKRVFDVVISIIALIILALPMAVIALVIKLDSPGPVIFSQERLGYNRKSFQMYKFRSMYLDAEDDGAHWTTEGDSRVTRSGHFLRNTRLDELPQFWNVLKGDMSLVGPRPEREVFYEWFETYIHGFSQRLLITPGITGLAQVKGGYSLSPEQKAVYDLEYIRECGIGMDLSIIVRTIGVIFTGKGAW